MAFKPFKPPTLKSVQDNIITEARSEPPLKKRRLSPEISSLQSAQAACNAQRSVDKAHRIPLNNIHNGSTTSDSGHVDRIEATCFYAVLWRKFTQKKHKTWDDDGFLSVDAGQAILYDGKGKRIGQGSCPNTFQEGALLSIAGREVEVGDRIKKQDFQDAVGTVKSGVAQSDAAKLAQLTAVPSTATLPRPKLTLKEQLKSELGKAKMAKVGISSHPTSRSIKRIPFKQPLKENTVLPQIPSEIPIPRHDPNLPDAVVFKRPQNAPAGCQLVDVVLDPLLSRHLRGHQRAGVKFLYECVMGLRDAGGEGCILADDMGLGKTLQTIALLWTLMKQNPVHKADPVVKKALIVCPVSLIHNWKKEFRKWLGRDRLGVLTLDEKTHRLSMFDGKNYKVMIIGYEKLRTLAEELTRGASIDIVVCDEGHRLKTLKNKSAEAIESLNTSRRVILSGTPIQNDLSEFFAMANFVNDGVLGSYKTFLKHFERPIMKSRQPDATADDIEKGEMASEELAKTTSCFILRRTADIVSSYLPPKTEYVLFCKPTPQQATVYREVLQSPMFHNALGSSETALQLITILKKLCNSPALMRPDRGADESTSSTSLTSLNDMLSPNISRYYSNRYATKIRILDELLQNIRTTTNDKVILVSNYTSTLNVMGQLLDSSGGKYLRLDGSVPQGKRQGMVDEFNNSPSSTYFAFLLSAKAGGLGLNLIGANRLVLFDVDWNPATDDQAMARIHREGQRKPCKIYRFVIKGGLEERIWQRQVVKRGLAASIMDGGSARGTYAETVSATKKGKAAFSREELRDLFRLDEKEGLRTHDLIGCACGGTGTALSNPVLQSDDEVESDLDDEQDLPDVGTLTKASELTDSYLKKQEARLAANSSSNQVSGPTQDVQEQQELMKFTHLDTSAIPVIDTSGDVEQVENLETLIDDDCLMHVLRLDRDVIAGPIAYIFKKTTGGEI